MDTTDYQLVDFDNHYYESEDCFHRHGDEEVRRFVRWVSEGKRRHLIFGHTMAMNIPNPTFNPIGKPGAYHQRLKELSESGEARNVHVMSRFGELEPLPEHYRNRDARVAVMDEQGVERAVFFPTLGVGVDGFNSNDIRMTYKLFRAFNRWIDDDWGFNRDGRIYGVPFIPMLDPKLACEELDYVLDRGARLVVMRPGPADGRSPADPVWDPYWARLEEAGVIATYHACPRPDDYSDSFAAMWQRHGLGDRTYENNLDSALNHLRPALEVFVALVLGNTFGRFPNLKVASVELGSAWVEFCLYTLDHAGGLVGRHIEAFGETVKDRPSDIFKNHIWISPFPEDDITRLVDVIGADRVLLGSDWPHLEGTPTPRDYLERLHKLDAADVRRITRDNGLELLG